MKRQKDERSTQDQYPDVGHANRSSARRHAMGPQPPQMEPHKNGKQAEANFVHPGIRQTADPPMTLKKLFPKANHQRHFDQTQGQQQQPDPQPDSRANGPAGQPHATQPFGKAFDGP
jgi:hypothetical protein